MAQISDKPQLREWLPMNTSVDYVPFYDYEHPEESTQRAVSTLKKYLERYPNQHALMIFELVQGEAGFYPGTKEFFEALMRILKKDEIAIMLDEIQTFGRTSQLFAFQHFGLDKYVDMVTIGKVCQVCATLYRKEYTPRIGLLGQTFTSSTAAIHAAKVVVQSLLRDGFFGPDGNNMQIQKRFADNLQKIADKHPKLLQGPFGIGSMVAFTPYDGQFNQTKTFVLKLFDAGVIAFIAGKNPTRARFLVPAGAVTSKDIDTVSKIVEDTLVSYSPHHT